MWILEAVALFIFPADVPCKDWTLACASSQLNVGLHLDLL